MLLAFRNVNVKIQRFKTHVILPPEIAGNLMAFWRFQVL